MKKTRSSPRRKPYLFEPLVVLKKFSSIGLDGDTLAELEQKARDDIAHPHKAGQLSRVEGYCLRRGILGISQVAPLFALAVKFGRLTGGKNAALYELLMRIVSELNHSKGQLTSLVDYRAKASSRSKR